MVVQTMVQPTKDEEKDLDVVATWVTVIGLPLLLGLVSILIILFVSLGSKKLNKLIELLKPRDET